MKKYSDKNFLFVLLFSSYLFVFLLSFSIPGYAFFGLIAGSLWGFKFSFILYVFLSTLGSTISYLLSHLFVKGFIISYFPNRVAKFVKKVEENK